MSTIRNIHKTLVTVLFTVGVGLLLMVAQTGHRVLASDAGWGMSRDVALIGVSGDVSLSGGVGANSGVGVNSGLGAGDLALSGGVTGDNELVEIGKKNLVETAHLPQIHNEGSAISAHKRPLNRHRSRFGLDGISSASFVIDHPHFEPKALPDVCRPGAYATILTGSSLRGPPCA